MIRTSMYLPDTLRYRLLLASQHEGKSVSQLVHELLDKALIDKEKTRIDHMYQALGQMCGIGQKGVTDGSRTIDEVLYGEHGVWNGREY